MSFVSAQGTPSFNSWAWCMSKTEHLSTFVRSTIARTRNQRADHDVRRGIASVERDPPNLSQANETPLRGCDRSQSVFPQTRPVGRRGGRGDSHLACG